jgi:hypothetical protein
MICRGIVEVVLFQDDHGTFSSADKPLNMFGLVYRIVYKPWDFSYEASACR